MSPCEPCTNCRRFRDRWSYLYLEHGVLDQEATGLVFHNADARHPVADRSAQPGHARAGHDASPMPPSRRWPANNCLLAWVGEDGVRLYAHSTGGTFSAAPLIAQARLVSDEQPRLAVAYRMYQKRFPGEDLDRQVDRAGSRHGRACASAQPYEETGHGAWHRVGRPQLRPGQLVRGQRRPTAPCRPPTPACTASATRPSCRPAIRRRLGFIHTGKMLSFVYDIADLYKTEVTVPVAFRLAATVTEGIWSGRCGMECRQAFHDGQLMERILPDIAEVLDAGDDLGESSRGA